jgi:hypothetical protein
MHIEFGGHVGFDRIENLRRPGATSRAVPTGFLPGQSEPLAFAADAVWADWEHAGAKLERWSSGAPEMRRIESGAV